MRIGLAVGTWAPVGGSERYALDVGTELAAAGDVAAAGRRVSSDDGYGNFFLPDRGMIDGFTADRPVLVRRFDRKVYLANAFALELAGIRKDTPDPDGILVARDEDGEPTGALFNPVAASVESTVLVRDNVRALFDTLIPEPSRAQRIAETTKFF